MALTTGEDKEKALEILRKADERLQSIMESIGKVNASLTNFSDRFNTAAKSVGLLNDELKTLKSLSGHKINISNLGIKVSGNNGHSNFSPVHGASSSSNGKSKEEQAADAEYKKWKERGLDDQAARKLAMQQYDALIKKANEAKEAEIKAAEEAKKAKIKAAEEAEYAAYKAQKEREEKEAEQFVRRVKRQQEEEARAAEAAAEKAREAEEEAAEKAAEKARKEAYEKSVAGQLAKIKEQNEISKNREEAQKIYDSQNPKDVLKKSFIGRSNKELQRNLKAITDLGKGSKSKAISNISKGLQGIGSSLPIMTAATVAIGALVKEIKLLSDITVQSQKNMATAAAALNKMGVAMTEHQQRALDTENTLNSLNNRLENLKNGIGETFGGIENALVSLFDSILGGLGIDNTESDTRRLPAIQAITSRAWQSGFSAPSGQNFGIATYNLASTISESLGMKGKESEVAQLLAEGWLTGSDSAVTGTGAVMNDEAFAGYMMTRSKRNPGDEDIDVVNVERSEAFKQYYRYEMLAYQLSIKNDEQRQEEIKSWTKLGNVMERCKQTLFSFDEVITLNAYDPDWPEFGTQQLLQAERDNEGGPVIPPVVPPTPGEPTGSGTGEPIIPPGEPGATNNQTKTTEQTATINQDFSNNVNNFGNHVAQFGAATALLNAVLSKTFGTDVSNGGNTSNNNQSAINDYFKQKYGIDLDDWSKKNANLLGGSGGLSDPGIEWVAESATSRTVYNKANPSQTLSIDSPEYQAWWEARTGEKWGHGQDWIRNKEGVTYPSNKNVFQPNSGLEVGPDGSLGHYEEVPLIENPFLRGLIEGIGNLGMGAASIASMGILTSLFGPAGAVAGGAASSAASAASGTGGTPNTPLLTGGSSNTPLLANPDTSSSQQWQLIFGQLDSKMTPGLSNVEIIVVPKGGGYASGGIGTKEVNNATLFEDGAEAVIPLESQAGIDFLGNAMRQAMGGEEGFGGDQIIVNLNLSGLNVADDDSRWEQIGTKIAEVIDVQRQRRGELNYGAAY